MQVTINEKKKRGHDFENEQGGACERVQREVKKLHTCNLKKKRKKGFLAFQ